MFREVWGFFINGIIKVINLTKSFKLDETLGITLFHFFLFLIFTRIVIFVLEYMKSIEVTVGENESEYEKEKRSKK